jgi:hypothetical protein
MIDTHAAVAAAVILLALSLAVWCRCPGMGRPPDDRGAIDHQHADIFDRIDDLVRALDRHDAEEERQAQRMGLGKTPRWRAHRECHDRFRQQLVALREDLTAHISNDDCIFDQS